MIQWPEFMPAPVHDPTQITAPTGAAIRSEMDAGPAKQRPRFTAAIQPVSLVFAPLSLSDYEAFEAFYKYDLKNGTQAFEMPHPFTDALRRFRFNVNDAWQIAPIGSAYQLTATLELLP